MSGSGVAAYDRGGPEQQPYGVRRVGRRDPTNFTLHVGTPPMVAQTGSLATQDGFTGGQSCAWPSIRTALSASCIRSTSFRQLPTAGVPRACWETHFESYNGTTWTDLATPWPTPRTMRAVSRSAITST